MSKQTITKRLRAWLDENPQGDLRRLYETFGGPEFSQLLAALDYLEKMGHFFAESSSYCYRGAHGNESTETKQTAIYNVTRNLAKVTRIVKFDDVVQLAEVDRSYARRYFNFLEGMGYVAKRFSGYAVLEKAMQQAKAPHFNQRQERARQQAAQKGGE